MTRLAEQIGHAATRPTDEPRRHEHLMPAAPEQPRGDAPAVARLSEYGNTLTIHQLAHVLHISVRTIEGLEADRLFPIPRLRGLGRGRTRTRRLYASADVARFLDERGHVRFARHQRRVR